MAGDHSLTSRLRGAKTTLTYRFACCTRVMNRSDAITAHAIACSVDLRDGVYPPHGVTDESIRPVGG
jgi:hypothetical protein